MNFKDFYEGEERRKGTYVSAFLTKDSNNRLFAWAEDQDFGDGGKVAPMSDYHVTVLYSRKPIPEEKQINEFVQYECKPKKFTVFPYENNTKCLVLELDSPEIEDIHKQLIKAGGTHDYADFIPHVTIAYNIDDSFIEKNLKLPRMDFYTLKIKSEPLDLNWKGTGA